MQSRPWLDQMTVEIFSPFLRRSVLITPMQFRLMVTVYSGWQGNQRALAATTGYTIGGLNDAIHQLHDLGVLARRVVRGRHGSTWLRVRRGVNVIERHVANVRQRIEQLSISRSKRLTTPRSSGRTFLRREVAWRSTAAVVSALATGSGSWCP